jgi:cell division protein FtsB
VPRLPRLSFLRVVVLVAAALVGYLLFAAGGDYLHSRQLRAEEKTVQQQIVELQRQHEELLAIREYLHSDEYIEGVARRILGLVRPGETLVVVTSSEASAGPVEEQGEGADPEEQESEDWRPWWERLFEP